MVPIVRYCLAIALLNLVACGKARLEQARFVNALVYLHELDAAIPDADSAGSPEWQERRRQALQHLGIPPETFEATYTYYLARPDRFMPIYQEVVDTLNVRRLAAMALGSDNPEAEPAAPTGPASGAAVSAVAEDSPHTTVVSPTDTAGMGGPSRRRLNAIREARRQADSLRQAQAPAAP